MNQTNHSHARLIVDNSIKDGQERTIKTILPLSHCCSTSTHTHIDSIRFYWIRLCAYRKFPLHIRLYHPHLYGSDDFSFKLQITYHRIFVRQINIFFPSGCRTKFKIKKTVYLNCYCTANDHFYRNDWIAYLLEWYWLTQDKVMLIALKMMWLSNREMSNYVKQWLLSDKKQGKFFFFYLMQNERWFKKSILESAPQRPATSFIKTWLQRPNPMIYHPDLCKKT